MSVRALSVLVLLVCTAAAAAATLERVELEATAPLVVRLRLDGMVRARSEEIPARDGQPARIVLDLPGTQLGTGVRGVAGAGRLRRVRIGQFDATTARVVLDLVGPTSFTVTDDGTDLRIHLAAETAAAPAPAPAPPPIAAPAPAPARTRPAPGAKGGTAPYLDYDDGDMQPLPTLPQDWKH